ncbi:MULTISPECIES: hypothetical protein [Photorhabdus]|nr:hypothetical protein [Photorhabdus thracensis]
MLTVSPGPRRFLYNSHLLYYVRILIALTGTMLVPWFLDKERDCSPP